MSTAAERPLVEVYRDEVVNAAKHLMDAPTCQHGPFDVHPCATCDEWSRRALRLSEAVDMLRRYGG